ncbi:GAF and ANTAR domain-containing protein [Arthrobacter sp. NPDC092385]|uniref:GAF and ANTAR domain-containing protein n=1 Tax=Arthrobacter sp. NPDC092385 TaxID=3363943 RepID=UPI00380CAF58
MADQVAGHSTTDYLQDLLLDTDGVEEFLTEFARFSAFRLFPQSGETLCGITLLRSRRAGTVASSNEAAKKLDELQYLFTEGPCLTACEEQRTVHVADTTTDERWSGYVANAAEHGVRSILAVPFTLEAGARAALNVYSTQPGAFGAEDIATAETFVAQTSRALMLAVRLAQHSESIGNLKTAMQSRTAIDIAIGIIMAQNRCSQTEAFTILKSVSSSRNQKVREIAASIVTSIGQAEPETHFDL